MRDNKPFQSSLQVYLPFHSRSVVAMAIVLLQWDGDEQSSRGAYRHLERRFQYRQPRPQQR